jgi:Ran GTPase-activating protein (RanGAP) involved in mRNA processing and transport
MLYSERCELVIQEVHRHTTLESVDVSDNHFDKVTGGLTSENKQGIIDFIFDLHSGSNFVDALSNSENLHSLSMTRNGCGDVATCRAFGRVLATHALTSLMLCGMSTPIQDDQGPSIVQGIRFCRTLRVLDLSANLIGDTTMFEFEKACIDHPKLRIVNLEGNVITEQGAYSLSKISRQFELLNVSHNKIGAGGVAALLASLGENNCRLESLYVHWNSFEDSGAGGGVGPKGLALNTSLRALNLSYMRVEDANSLGAGLILNKFLISIDLSHNELQDNSIQFMTGIASNENLEMLDFSFNRIGTRGTLWILKGLAEKLRSQKKSKVQVRLHNNFYESSLEDIISDVNNIYMSVALRIERCEIMFTAFH